MQRQVLNAGGSAPWPKGLFLSSKSAVLSMAMFFLAYTKCILGQECIPTIADLQNAMRGDYDEVHLSGEQPKDDYTYTLCGGTYQLEATEWSPEGKNSILIALTLTTLQCEQGKECIISDCHANEIGTVVSPQLQILTPTQASTFYGWDVAVNGGEKNDEVKNVVVRGLTFTGCEGGINVGAIGADGSSARFEDCTWTDNDAVANVWVEADAFSKPAEEALEVTTQSTETSDKPTEGSEANVTIENDTALDITDNGTSILIKQGYPDQSANSTVNVSVAENAASELPEEKNTDTTSPTDDPSEAANMTGEATDVEAQPTDGPEDASDNETIIGDKEFESGMEEPGETDTMMQDMNTAAEGEGAQEFDLQVEPAMEAELQPASNETEPKVKILVEDTLFHGVRRRHLQDTPDEDETPADAEDDGDVSLSQVDLDDENLDEMLSVVGVDNVEDLSDMMGGNNVSEALDNLGDESLTNVLDTVAALEPPAVAEGGDDSDTINDIQKVAVSVNVYEGPSAGGGMCEEGDTVKQGDYLKMHYTGTIDESSETGEKGKKFDSSRDRGQPFDFQIGVGQVIPGWDQGIVGLCKGDNATLVIPAELGYGEQGAGADIPGGATLNFDVEVLEISDGSLEKNEDLNSTMPADSVVDVTTNGEETNETEATVDTEADIDEKDGTANVAPALVDPTTKPFVFDAYDDSVPSQLGMTIVMDSCDLAENVVEDALIVNAGGKLSLIDTVMMNNDGDTMVANQHAGTLDLGNACIVSNTFEKDAPVMSKEGSSVEGDTAYFYGNTVWEPELITVECADGFLQEGESCGLVEKANSFCAKYAPTAAPTASPTVAPSESPEEEEQSEVQRDASRAGASAAPSEREPRMAFVLLTAAPFLLGMAQHIM